MYDSYALYNIIGKYVNNSNLPYLTQCSMHGIYYFYAASFLSIQEFIVVINNLQKHSIITIC